jgi:hypothetical protein
MNSCVYVCACVQGFMHVCIRMYVCMVYHALEEDKIFVFVCIVCMYVCIYNMYKI